MLQKVKKLGSKLFGDTPNEGADELRSGASMSRSSGIKAVAYVGRKSDMMDTDNGSFSKSSAHLHGTNASHGTLTDPPGAMKSHLVLPPVQVSSSSNTSQGNPSPPPPAVAGLIQQAATGGSGRRKSTPAALDMALRTAEGKAAIEELINSAGKKQMVFGQYFGNTAASGSDKNSRFAKPGALALGVGSVGPGNSKPMSPVMEDEDHHEEPVKPSPKVVIPTPVPPAHQPVNNHASSINSPLAASPIASSSHQPMDVTPAASSAPAAAAPSSSRPVATSQKRPADGTPPPTVPLKATAMQVDEVPPARQTKLLALAQQLPTGMSRKFWSLSDYSIMRKMYVGYASTVYQATCKKSLEQVALKVYHMENLCELNHYQVYREIRVHAGLSHQNIIGLYCAFQEGNDVVMVQEYAEGGDLYRLLHRNGGRLSERQAVEMVLHPFLLSLHYLHTRGIMHRDIKPENVLFTEHRVLKLADFGLAIDLTEERAVTRAGTLDYMAPEVLRCPPKNLPQENKNNVNLHYNNSVDAWAVGVFAFELIVGVPPFAGESQLASVDKIIHATPEFPEKISELAKAFITAALKKHPGDRPTVMEMLHHPWIRTYQRRTSVRIPQMIRRRSSVQYPGAGGLAPAPEDGPLPGAPDNLDNMTPEEIEKMIQRLQMAKHGVM